MLKVTNYNRGYHTWCDCVIHGTIYIPRAEATKLLNRNVYNHYKDLRLPYFSLGMTETQRYLKSKGIDYRLQNYQFKII